MDLGKDPPVFRVPDINLSKSDEDAGILSEGNRSRAEAAQAAKDVFSALGDIIVVAAFPLS